ncbi:MAG: hypothetical protein LBT05_02140 [Planctomycetaceae bacterium]|jgi:hypothetical protein|nr:hypothetical protein [Planctomycetaceae bacterium]
MTKNILLFLCLSAALFSVVGCTGRVKVSGNVKFSDGEALNFGEVCFTEGEKTFFGRIKEDGYYSPGEFQDGDGIPPGTYQVWLARTVLSEPIRNKNGEESDEVKQTDRVDKKYTAPETTELTFEVKRGGSKKFDFIVERPSKMQVRLRR